MTSIECKPQSSTSIVHVKSLKIDGYRLILRMFVDMIVAGLIDRVLVLTVSTGLGAGC